jgi:hypothetical protein
MVCFLCVLRDLCGLSLASTSSVLHHTSMFRALCLSLLMLGASAPVAPAHHFTIDLQVEAAGQSRTAHAETLALAAKPKTRPVLHVKRGDRVKVKWVLTNSHAKDSFKDVVIHFFAVKEEQADQRVVPKLGKSVTVESASTVDFRPGDKTRAELSFTIDAPGAYLLRLETIGAAIEPGGHEHYAALDVVVQ